MPSLIGFVFWGWMGLVPIPSKWYVLVHHNEVQINGKSELLFGDEVNADSKIILGAHSYVSLFSEEGDVVEFEKEGTYQLENVKLLPARLIGFSGKELIEKSGYARIEKPYAGVVCAGIPIANFLTGGGSFFEEDSVRIEWKGMSQDSSFTFFILNEAHDELLYTVETTTDHVNLSLVVKAQLKDLEDEVVYAKLLSHAYHGESEIPLRLKSLRPNDKDLEWRQSLLKAYSDKTAANCLLRAMILVQHDFPYAADAYFKKAARLKSEVPEFGKVYKSYRKQFEVDCK